MSASPGWRSQGGGDFREGVGTMAWEGQGGVRRILPTPPDPGGGLRRGQVLRGQRGTHHRRRVTQLFREEGEGLGLG